MTEIISKITGFATEISASSSDAISNLLVIGFFLIFYFVMVLAIYIYTSLAFMAIAKKAKHENPWLAWIPFVGKPLLSAQIAKMHWWPILFLIPVALAVLTSIAIPLIGALLILLAIPFWIAFSVFYIIWRWKTFEAVGHPGWFVLFVFVNIVYYIFLGIVAWSNENAIEQKRTRRK
jgi:hypothetical protein